MPPLVKNKLTVLNAMQHNIASHEAADGHVANMGWRCWPPCRQHICSLTLLAGTKILSQQRIGQSHVLKLAQHISYCVHPDESGVCKLLVKNIIQSHAWISEHRTFEQEITECSRLQRVHASILPFLTERTDCCSHALKPAAFCHFLLKGSAFRDPIM